MDIPRGVGISVWLDEETHDLLIEVVKRMEVASGQRMTSGKAVKQLLDAWLMKPAPLD